MSLPLYGTVSLSSQCWEYSAQTSLDSISATHVPLGILDHCLPICMLFSCGPELPCNIILFCCMKSSSLLICLSPFSSTLRQWNFLLNEGAQLLEGENRVFVLFLLSTIIQSLVPPLGRTGGWLAVSLTEGDQCSGKLDNRIKIYGATGIPSKLAPPVKTVHVLWLVVQTFRAPRIQNRSLCWSSCGVHILFRTQNPSSRSSISF